MKALYDSKFGFTKIIALLIIMSICIDSCKSGSEIIDQKNVKGIDSDFEVTLLNTSYRAEKNKKKVQYKYKFLHLLNLYDIKTDTIHIRFNNKDELIVNYIEKIKGLKRTQEFTFQGEFRRNKGYEIVLVKERIRIPPIIPIIFGKTNIDKINLKTTPEGDIVITNYYRRDGNIFVLAAGNSETINYFFKKIN